MKTKYIFLFLVSATFSASAQPILYQEKIIPHAIATAIFPRGAGEYDLITNYEGVPTGLCVLDAQFDSVRFRGANFTFFGIQSIFPSLDSGYFVSGPALGNPIGFRAGGGLLTPSGYSIWQANSAYSGTQSYGRGAIITPDSGYLVVGVADSGSIKRKVLLTHITRSGVVSWEKVHGEISQVINPVLLTNRYLVLVYGQPGINEPSIQCFNLNGDLLWTSAAVVSGAFPVQLCQISPNRLWLLSSKPGTGSTVNVVCMDSTANVLWERDYQSLDVNTINPSLISKFILADGNGGAYILADKTEGSNFERSQSLFLLDSLGNLSWHYEFGIGQFQEGKSISFFPGGRILTLSTGYIPNVANGYQSLLAEFGPDTTLSNPDLRSDFALHLQPQPVTDVLEISLSLDQPSALALTLLDLQGRTVLNQSRDVVAGNNRLSLDLGSLPAGVYLLRAEAGGRVSAQKVVKR